jgi:hypothetical protein
MTDMEPRRREVVEIDMEIEMCSQSYASARIAKDAEGMAIVRSRYLELEIQVREINADY